MCGWRILTNGRGRHEPGVIAETDAEAQSPDAPVHGDFADEHPGAGEFIQELVQENPAAELAEPPDPGDESEELWRRLQSLADLDHQNRQYVTADRDELDPLARVGTDGGWPTPCCSI